MNEFGKQLNRKVKDRMFAVHNMGKNEENFPDSDEEEQLDELCLKIEQQILCANYYYSSYADLPINSNKKVNVFFKSAMKKLLQKTLGWYINPILERQTAYNASMLEISTILRSINKTVAERLAENAKNIEENTESIEANIKSIETNHENIEANQKNINYFINRMGVSCDLDLLEGAYIDYMAFENRFRGTRENIMAAQNLYVKYFEGCSNDILDIGCGRGEFLELMWNNAIPARGIDCYLPFVDYCKKRDFRVEQADALTYLSSLKDGSLGGIFMAHVVEHLSNDYIIKLIETAYRKLAIGAYFVLETPNPECLTTYRNFYIDLEHTKPIHYHTLNFLFTECGFTQVDKVVNPATLYRDYVKDKVIRIPEIQGKEIENLQEFNTGIEKTNEVLFGYLDYSLVAKK